MKQFVSAKIHGIKITGLHREYHGSQTLPLPMMQEVGIECYEKVLCVNLDNGKRWETYAIPGKDGECTLNGAAAFNGEIGDRLIIIAFRLSEKFTGAKVVFINAQGAASVEKYEASA